MLSITTPMAVETVVMCYTMQDNKYKIKYKTKELDAPGSGGDLTTVPSFISFTIELASESVIGESVHGTDPTSA